MVAKNRQVTTLPETRPGPEPCYGRKIKGVFWGLKPAGFSREFEGEMPSGSRGPTRMGFRPGDGPSYYLHPQGEWGRAGPIRILVVTYPTTEYDVTKILPMSTHDLKFSQSSQVSFFFRSILAFPGMPVAR